MDHTTVNSGTRHLSRVKNDLKPTGVKIIIIKKSF